MSESINKAFADCLELLENKDATLRECLSRYPEYEQELAELLEFTYRINILQTLTPRTSFSEGAGSRLAARLPDRKEPFRPGIKIRSRWQNLSSLLVRSLRATAIATVVLVLLALFAGGTVLTANAAGPGDLLYGVDRAVERLQLNLAAHPEAVAMVHLDNAEERLDEAQSKLARGEVEDVQAALEGYSSEISDLANLVGGAEGVDKETLGVLVTAARSKHLVVLAEILDNAPEPARAGLQRTIMASNSLFDDLDVHLNGGVPPENPPVNPGPPCGEPPCGPPEDVGPPCGDPPCGPPEDKGPPCGDPPCGPPDDKGPSCDDPPCDAPGQDKVKDKDDKDPKDKDPKDKNPTK